MGEGERRRLGVAAGGAEGSLVSRGRRESCVRHGWEREIDKHSTLAVLHDDHDHPNDFFLLSLFS